ncbi:MAG: DUF4340 domain-containing protein [Clostridiales bacterium]|nr:DUF4340 domain-containing protein [Clostridiales bacterium]
MKRRRNLIIMAVVLVALCGVILIEQTVTRHVDSINTIDEVILTVDQDALTNVTWTYDGDTLTFEKTDDVWYDSDDADFPVDQDALADFLEWFEEVHATFIIDDVEDYSQYGLDDPDCTITMTTEDGETVVSVGDYSTMDEQRYIEIGDGKVYLVEDDVLESVSTERDDFMQQDEIASVVTLDEMTVSGEKTLDAVYDTDGNYSYTDSYNYYNIEDGNYQTLDDSFVESYLDSLASADLTDYVTYTATDDDLAEYGLDDPAYTITISGTAEVETEDDSDESDDSDEDESDDDYSDDDYYYDDTDTADETSTEEESTEEAETEDVEFVIYIGTVTEEADDDDEEDTVTGYLRVGDSSIIYQLSDEDFDALAACGYDDLRPTDVFSLDWDAVTSLSFTIDGETYDVSTMTWKEYKKTLTDEEKEELSDDEDEPDIVYLINDQRVDFDTVIDAIDALAIETFDEEENSDTLELSVTINVDNDDYPSITADIYQYDGDSCLVVVDGETIGLMSRSLMVDLREGMTSITLGLE